MVKYLGLLYVLLLVKSGIVVAQVKPDTVHFAPFVWKSVTPGNCPFKPSKQLTGLKFLGLKSGFHAGDTWYPTWGDDDKMYSPFTDGDCPRLDGARDLSYSFGNEPVTGQAVIEGTDPLNISIYSLGTTKGQASPYQGRYPCGSLIYNKVWYYGTYCLGPDGQAKYNDTVYNWPWMGPLVGFRYSTDYGRSWKDCPHTPEKPIFGESGLYGYPVKIGAPHFVDFGKNMQYSPDGKAYLIAHGAEINNQPYRFFNDSWITGDQIYLIRVTPSIENINNPAAYEYYAGKDAKGKTKWTNDFKMIRPLLEWDNNMGSVTATYNHILKKYIMCITDGGNTVSKMNTYLLESDALDGEWKLITYMKDFGEQAYFVNIPSRFISEDGKTAWLMYSGNFSPNWNGVKLNANPPGSHYGMVMQKIEFMD